MDWNTQFAHMMGEATEMMYGSHFLDATEAMQRAFIGAPAAAAVASVIHSSAQVPDALLPDPQAAGSATSPPEREAPDSFQRIAVLLNGALHHYWLYVPPDAAAGTPMPLVMMLHGCSQEAKEFAIATDMNPAAAQAHTLVLYPEQARGANPGGCWNWFEPDNQRRGQGELGLMVAMLHDVMARHPVDAQRVYAAGISAGGAMAALLAREYPELFAAIGVHSGLQAGAADNMMAALSAMNNGAKLGPQAQPTAHPSGAEQPALIVFHGDADTTVHVKNGQQLVEAALQAALGEQGTVQHETLHGQSSAGQGFTRTMYRAAPPADAPADSPQGADVLAEHWVLHSAGHAWSGGNARVSQTDARGVSATQEMLRFFLEHARTS
ncbi:extracellular catalytic domain type 1 short-chain-length polyhydroxyalkanoate depolymerase [Simplicispira psychrophila]|uniref:extracellular catalytic domain type 1 short-chain-length polyhydroxyalkanoate depolymerase n=1 Tax=Simplicispira psychrophila TaxID=80882 RepID=UPI00055D1FA4|nr:PHB depolymerase family esterase [Simplicispira psychrophila]